MQEPMDDKPLDEKVPEQPQEQSKAAMAAVSREFRSRGER